MIQGHTRSKIEQCLSERLYINLATCGPTGQPLAHTVGFAYDEGEDCLYFMTSGSSRKAANIAKNPLVAFTAEADVEDLLRIQGVQMTGEAMRVGPGAEFLRAMAMLVAKYPQMKKLPPDPGHVLFKIVFKEGTFIDNTRGFGTRETVVY